MVSGPGISASNGLYMNVTIKMWSCQGSGKEGRQTNHPKALCGAKKVIILRLDWGRIAKLRPTWGWSSDKEGGTGFELFFAQKDGASHL